MLHRLKYISIIVLLIASLTAFGEPARIDSVCINSTRVYRVNGVAGSTYEWLLTDNSGNKITLPAPEGNPFSDIDPDSGQPIQGSEISIFWSVPGAFNVQVVQTSVFGCDSIQVGKVQVYDLPTAYAGTPATICQGGTWTLSVATASNYRTLLWTSSGDGTFDDPNSLHPVYTPGPNDVLAGTVKLTITADGKGVSTTCPPATSSLVLTIISLEANVAGTRISCFGANDGKIQISGATGGSGDYEYRLNTQPWASSANFSNLGPGSYDVWIRDKSIAVCEIKLQTVEIIEPAKLAATVKYTDATCLGNDGTVKITNPQGGWGNYMYILNSLGQGFGTFTGLAPGSYDVWIADADYPDCKILLQTVTIKAPDPMTAELAKTDVTCFSGNDGTITVSKPQNGSGVYEYSIDGAEWQTDPVFKNLAKGDYTVLIRDFNAPECQNTIGTQTLNEPEKLQASTSYTDVRCYGSHDGTITISNMKGGSGTYEATVDGINWNSTGIFTGLGPGVYYAMIRDPKGKDCIEFIKEITIVEPLQMLASVVSTDITCHGANDGSITVSNAVNGQAPYQYSIDGGVSWNPNNAIGSLGPGVYDVVLRDAKNCEQELGSITLVEPDPLYADVASTNVTCVGHDGTITLTNPANAVSGTYEYSINDGASWSANSLFAGLDAGKYVVKIRDAKYTGCELTLNTITITEPEPLAATPVKTDITCFGANNGTIEIQNPSGGSGLYEFSVDGTLWSSNQTIANLKPGTYTVAMRDANSIICLDTIGVLTIAEPNKLEATVSVADVTCYGGYDGSLTFGNMSGGSGAWEFSVDGTNWYPSEIDGLKADIYPVMIRDANHTDCVVDLGPYEIKQPPQLSALVTPANVSCFGGNDGAITISNPQNGKGPYQYSIDGGTTWMSVGTFTGLTAGTYNLLIIQDANSCTAKLDDVVILQPEQIEATAQHTNETLPGANDGTITVVNQAGGSGIYIYSLDGINWQSQSVFAGLAPGTYNVYVGDGKVINCYIILKVIILPAGTISANYTISPVTCFGGFDGSITFVNVAGAANIEFSINGGVTWFDNPNFAGLSAQEYNLEIRDKDNPSNVVVLGTVEIKQPQKLDAVATVTNETFSGAGDGKITVSGATGGSGVFEYSKDGLNWQSGNEFSGLTSGTYDIYIRDKNAPSCMISIQKVINPAGSLQADVAHTDVLCKGDATGVIMITNPSGATKYNYSVNGGTTWVTKSVITGLVAGTYDVRIQDANNPANTAALGQVVIREPANKLSLYTEMQPPLCHDGTGKLIVVASGGTPPYLNSGTYTIPAGKNQTIVVTDANGCKQQVAVKMPNPDPVVATAVATPALCYGENGTIIIKATGGTGAYTLNGKKVPANGEITVEWPNGTPYSFMIRDSNGCQSNVISGTLSGPEQLVVNLTPIEPLCNGTGGNTIRVSATGGTPPYSGIGDFKRTSGTYTFTVTDAKGCSASGTINILLKDPPAAPQANVTKPDCNDRKGTIQVTSPLGSEYQYRFDGGAYQAGSVWTGLDPGSTHTIQVLDVSSGCESGLATFTIDLIPEPAQSPVVAVTQPNCYQPLGTVKITDPAAGTGYQYSIDGGAFGDQLEFTGLLPGSSHTVKVLDVATGCESLEVSAKIDAMPANPATPVIIVAAAPTCDNLDGTVQVTKPVGAEYEYRIGGGTYQSSPVFPGLKTNDYTIDVRNSTTGCVSSGTISVPAIPASPTLVATPVNCICFGDNGRIDFTFTGVPDGTYTITYDKGQFDGVKVAGSKASVTVPAGTYSNLIIEANGCTSIAGVTAVVTQPNLISISAQVTEIDLKTNTKGSIALQVNGGTAGATGYKFVWAPDPANGFSGAVTKDISGLGKGTYHVTVTDANGCVKDTIIIMPPPNYPPVAMDDDFSIGCGILSGVSLFADNGHGVDRDPENDQLFFDPGLISQPAHGTITMDPAAPGMFTYVADQGYSGIDTFRYVISDPRGNISNKALVTITVIADFDSDGIPDDIDPDADGDGILNVDEALPGQDWRTADNDGDGHPNWLDIDSDDDGIVDNIEAQNGKGPNSVEDPGKPEYVAPSGKDVNHNGIDDAYDPAVGGTRLVPVDTDGDGIPDFLDIDSENDHVPDYIEGNDANHDGIADFVKTGRDSDGDGLDDIYDIVDRCADPLANITGSASPLQDTDGDGTRDWRDTNDDNDPYPTQYEDLNGDGDFSNDDTNHDGIPEYLDPIRDCALFVPEAFSPNGDNIHDYFQVYCIEDYPNARMYIFDSYGNKLFQKEHYGNVQFWGSYENAWWDGKTTNRAAATNSTGKVIPGTYFYVLQLGNGEVKKSYVFVSY